MELERFWKLVEKYKWFLIIVPLCAAGVTYFFVRNLPQRFKAQSQISTGLIDRSQQVSGDNRNMDYFKTNVQFGNLIAMLQMQGVMSALSYELILHDLQHPDDAFRKEGDLFKKLNSQKREELIDAYTALKMQQETLTPFNDSKLPLYALVEESGYDEESVRKDMEVSHVENSDFIKIAYTSENPYLSALVVNSLSEIFTRNYGTNVSNNQRRNIHVLDSLLQDKQAIMNDKNAQLKSFKLTNGALNLDRQSEIVYEQLTANEEARAQTLREIQSLQGAISGIDNKLNAEGSAYSSSKTIAENGQLISLRAQLQKANDDYVDNGFQASDKERVDALQQKLSAMVSTNASSATTNSATTRQGLVDEKLRMEVALDRAKSSLSSINAQLSSLQGRYARMAPADANAQNIARDAELATQAYMEALDRYNQANVESDIGARLGIAQKGVPGPAERSKTMIYVGLSGASSLTLCVAMLFLVFITDSTIKTPGQLSAAAKGRVFASIPLLQDRQKDVPDLWTDEKDHTNTTAYKAAVRNLRFEMDKLLSSDNSSVLGITSLYHGAGKSFVAESIAYAFASTKRKVLLIGGSEDKERLKLPGGKPRKLLGKAKKDANEKEEDPGAASFDSFLDDRKIESEGGVTILNKADSAGSLLEMRSATELHSAFLVLREEFDLIIIDSDSMSNTNRAKEWLLFADRTLAVYPFNEKLTAESKELLETTKELPGFAGWILNKTA